ncbi:MAG: crosslink repair DNA glycosylase YcaQ family protein, partial [Anaerolineae bacterium]|nr:crosslink repair DNA glycosylase YcaQ family protein [Anaerolineae bacterium]
GGQLFEHWLHLPGALPASDFALIHDPEKAAAASEPGSPGALVLEFLAEHGTASVRELQAHLRQHGWMHRRSIARAVHELYASGAILIRRREGSLESYDLARRVLPTRADEVLPTEERLRGLARRALHVLAPVTRSTLSQVLNSIGLRSRLDLAA